MTDIFERATRAKLRFPSSVGHLTTEQVWDLPLTARGQDAPDLDKCARHVAAELRSVSEDSFVDERPNPGRADLELRLEVLKHVIGAKKAEREATQARAARAEERRQLTEALAAQQRNEIGQLSREDLERRIAELDRAA